MDCNVSSDEVATEICFKTYIVRRPTTSYVINSAFSCLVNVILAILGTFLNALVVTVYWKTPKLRNKVSYFMIMLLSCNDLCVTIIVHPTYVMSSVAEITQQSKCVYKMVYQTSTVLLSGMSYLTFVVMNIDRYLSICQPFFHKANVTKKRCLILSSCLWPISIVTAIVPIFGLDIQFFTSGITVVAVGGVLFMYVSIYRVAKKRRKTTLVLPANRTGESALSITMDLETTSTALVSCDTTRPKKALSFFHDIQLAKMYVIVVFTTILLNIPNAFILVMFSGRVKTIDGVAHAKVWTLTLISMNSTFNSLIFFWANRMLREEGWKLSKKFLNFLREIF